MWPDKKTAVVLIHGAGHHEPFHFMDQIVRGFGEYLEGENLGLDLRWSHNLRKREAWVENYISLLLPGKLPTLDFYEYYWDIYMTNKVSFSEVAGWTVTASEGAKRFYDRADWKQRAEKYAQEGVPLFKDDEFKSGGYLIFFGKLAILVRLLAFFRTLETSLPIIGGISRILSGAAGKVLDALLNVFAEFISEKLADIVTYLGYHERSTHFAIRQKVLQGAVEHIGALLKDPDYEQVIIIGHSLGTVIGYDAINRIISEVNAAHPNTGAASYTLPQAEKIVGFVTMGSPLDKIAFFVREQVFKQKNGVNGEKSSREPYVRAHLLEHYHGFKARSFFQQAAPVEISDPYKFRLEHAKWLNFYHYNDPVSGHLDAYDPVDNIPMKMEAKWLIEAHGAYWQTSETFERIAKAFFQP